MGASDGVLGNSKVTHKEMRPDSARVKVGLQKLRAAMIHDAKQKSSRRIGLPKDWRNRIIE